MFGNGDEPTTRDLELLEELELNTRDSIENTRERDSLQLKIPTSLEPGNASDRGTLKIGGTSKEVSSTTLLARFDAPVGVGDIYRVEFDRSELDVPATFALCEQCSISGAEFEATLTFFAPIELS